MVTLVRQRCITPEGFARLREEFERLWKSERPRVTEEVARAAAQGDRSENAEYIYGKKRLREIDARLRLLSKRMDELSVVSPGEVPEDRIFFGAWVRLEGEDGALACYRLVGPDETDAAQGLISIESPLGRVLLGRGPGDEVVVQRPAGVHSFLILEIAYGVRPTGGD